MNDREFVCSRTILLYFFRTGLFIKAGGTYLLERFIYALARSFEHLLDFRRRYIVIVHRQAFNIATNTRNRIRRHKTMYSSHEVLFGK